VLHFDEFETRYAPTVNSASPPYRLPPGVVTWAAEPLLRDAARIGLDKVDDYTPGTRFVEVSELSQARVIVVEGEPLFDGVGQWNAARTQHHQYIPGGVMIVSRIDIPEALLAKVVEHEGFHAVGLDHSDDVASVMYGNRQTWEDLGASELSAVEAWELRRLYRRRPK
jgi:predicted Zn-dependent protease